MKYLQLLTLSAAVSFAACQNPSQEETTNTQTDTSAQPKTDTNSLIYPQEKNFATLTQLTNGGDNAEAYFSFDNQKLVFQSNYEEWGVQCDQIFYHPLSAGHLLDSSPQMISNNEGRTTCSYFMPGDSQIVYAGTMGGGKKYPPDPDRSEGYMWGLFPEYDIYVAGLQGNIVKQLTDAPGYDAEATVSPKGDKIVFTSTRSGDLELWTMDIDGSNQKQITHGLGYDGGAFFSPDGTKLVFRASRPKGEAADRYRSLLKKDLVAPSDMEIYVCDVDGSNLKQVTNLGNANWAPFFHPSGKKIIFSSNHHSEGGFHFNLFMINVDGTGLKQITFDDRFDAFPMFSFDGKKLVFSSNRNNGGTRSTNIFVADWVE